MANLNDRSPENVIGRFYVDSTCIDCGICRDIAPASFRLHEEIGLSIVYHQPTTAAEIELAEQAITSCPTESIGNDGPEVAEIRSAVTGGEGRD